MVAVDGDARAQLIVAREKPPHFGRKMEVENPHAYCLLQQDAQVCDRTITKSQPRAFLCSHLLAALFRRRAGNFESIHRGENRTHHGCIDFLQLHIIPRETLQIHHRSQ